MNPTCRACLLSFLATGFSGIAQAEITTFVCDYKIWSDSEGTHTVDEPFVLTFIIDADTAKAYMKGNLGTEDVQTVAGDQALTLIEISKVGNVITTTIDSGANSVHSRNTVIFGELVPSQYYGTCIVQ